MEKQGEYTPLPSGRNPYYGGVNDYPQGGPAPPYYTGYAPAQPVMQQNSNTNVVVVGQPTSEQGAYPVAVVVPRATEFKLLTIVLCVLCLIHFNLVFAVLLIPALICSFVAADHNDAGEYDSAKQCGFLALCWNITVLVLYALIVIAAVVIAILFVVNVINSTNNCIICDESGNCHYICE